MKRATETARTDRDVGRGAPGWWRGVGAILLLLLLGYAGPPVAAAPPAPGAEPSWDRIVQDVSIDGDVVVPAGQKWLIGANVRIAGNLRTDGGTIAMRPGSSLEFVGADPEEYVGGGMTFEPQFARDLGIWVSGTGVLDIQGTPKTGWNRTGSDPTWKSTDELWIAPTDQGDYRPRRWRPGQPIPRIHPRAPAAEVINVTRDVLIEGPGHILIHSSEPQRIEYVTLRHMGVTNRARGATTGRYAIHFHFTGDGSRGSIVRGVAAIESGGRVFVPHEAHGITFEDVVSVNSFGEAFWWDDGDRSDDILVDRLAATGVHAPRGVIGRTSRHSVVVLGGGRNITIRNSAASGARGSKIANGFDWPSKGDNRGPAVWDFSDGNVAHNNQGAGIRLWFNSRDPHVVANAVTYRNGYAGLENGAYRNAIRYQDVVAIDDRILQHASSNRHQGDLGPSRFERVTVIRSEGPAVSIGRMRLPPVHRTEFIDCELRPGPGAPKIVLEERPAHPFVALFRRCGVEPEDIEIEAPFPRTLAGTSVIIEHESGKTWEVTLDMEANRKVVRALP
jgi:hypothetical protein